MADPSGAADDPVGGARSVPAGRALPDGVLMIGRIGRAHGVRGDVLVEPRTDDPDARFAAGAVIVTDPAARGPLTVERSYWHSGKLVVNFAGVDDRTSAEALRGVVLVLAAADRPALEDDDDFYDSDLIGLRVLDASGTDLGVVTDVVHSAASDLLAIALDGDAREHLMPFVRDMVPTVDLEARTVTITPPEGLFDL